MWAVGWGLEESSGSRVFIFEGCSRPVATVASLAVLALPLQTAETWPEDMKRLFSDMKLVAQTCDPRGKETKAAATPGSQPGSLGLGGTLQGLGSCELHNSRRFFRAGGRSRSEQLGGSRGLDSARGTAPGGETYVQRVSCLGCPPLRTAGLGTPMGARPALSCSHTE